MIISKTLLLFYLVLLCSIISCGGSSGTTESSATCSQDDCGLCEDDREGVRICRIIASPSNSEAVIIMNYLDEAQDLDGWSLWDENALENGSGQENLNGVIGSGDELELDSLQFQINDSGETIYLRDDSGSLVDERSN